MTVGVDTTPHIRELNENMIYAVTVPRGVDRPRSEPQGPPRALVLANLSTVKTIPCTFPRSQIKNKITAPLTLTSDARTKRKEAGGMCERELVRKRTSPLEKLKGIKSRFFSKKKTQDARATREAKVRGALHQMIVDVDRGRNSGLARSRFTRELQTADVAYRHTNYKSYNKH